MGKGLPIVYPILGSQQKNKPCKRMLTFRRRKQQRLLTCTKRYIISWYIVFASPVFHYCYQTHFSIDQLPNSHIAGHPSFVIYSMYSTFYLIVLSTLKCRNIKHLKMRIDSICYILDSKAKEENWKRYGSWRRHIIRKRCNVIHL